MRNKKFYFLIGISFFIQCSSPSLNHKKMGHHDKALHLLAIAQGSLIEGDQTEALHILSEVEKLDSNIPELYHALSIAYLKKKDYLKAEHFAKKCLSLDPHASHARNTLGKILIEEKLFDEAEKQLRQASSDPFYKESYKALTNLGLLFYQKNEFDTAKNFFQKAWEENADLSCIALYYQGNIFLKENKINQAITSYQKSTRGFCASYKDPHLAIGQAYEIKGDYHEAKKKYLDILKMYPQTDIADKALQALQLLPVPEDKNRKDTSSL